MSWYSNWYSDLEFHPHIMIINQYITELIQIPPATKSNE